MSKAVTINSFSDYINCVVQIKPRQNEYGLLPEELVFRGLSCKEYPLIPYLGRRPVEHWINSYLSIENDLVSQAMQKFPDDFLNLDLPVAILAKLQHFCIPTRMMDVTSSALVALYFACQQSKDMNICDGEVVVFSNVALPASNVFANIIADTYRLTKNSITRVTNYCYRALQQDYCISEVFSGWENKIEEISNHISEKIKRPLLVESFENSIRQKNQQGKYLIFPNKITDEKNINDRDLISFLVVLEKDDPSIVKRIIIPAEIKKDILTKLKLLGITEEFLFADNKDTVLKSVVERQTDRYRNT